MITALLVGFRRVTQAAGRIQTSDPDGRRQPLHSRHEFLEA